MEVRVLGALRVIDGDRIIELTSPTHRTIVAMLAAHVPDVLVTDRLIDAIWGENLPAKPFTALQIQVSRLRKLLPADAIVTTDVGYRLAVDPLAVDAHLFRALSTDADRAGDRRGGERVVLAEALELWRGEPFADVPGGLWSDAIVAELTQARISLIERDLRSRLERDIQDDGLVGDLERASAEYPFHEGFTELLMRGLYRSGRPADALRVFGDFRRYLADELGLKPSVRLSDVELGILTHDHRLAPVAAELDLEGVAPARPLTSFVGRTDELRRLTDAITEHRLVTVIGHGGVGKTRLVTEVFEFIDAARPQRAWFVPFSDLDQGSLVSGRVAAELDIEIPGGLEPTDAIVRRISDWSCTLVLDNCENVIDDVAGFVHRILGECPAVRVVTTSREPLRLAGERKIRLGGLGVGTAESPKDAELLLVGRAELIEGESLEPALVSDLCRLVDGWPLAVELVAANLSRVDLPTVVAQLDDVINAVDSPYRFIPDRHASLAATLDWSYRLLPDRLRAAYRTLGVFDGPIELDAVAAILGTDDVDRAVARPQVEAGGVAEILASLAERSLLEIDVDSPTRFTMLRPVVQHARARLDEDTDEMTSVSTSFIDHYSSLSAAADALIGGPQASDGIEELTSEHSNIVRAIDLAAVLGQSRSSATITKNMTYFWLLRSLQPVGVVWVGRALDLPVDEIGWERRADLLQAAGFLYGSMGAVDAAGGHLEECLALQEANDDPAVVPTINNLCNVLEQQVRLHDAIALLDRADELMPAYRAVAPKERSIAAEWGLAIKRASLSSELGFHAEALRAAQRGMKAAEVSQNAYHRMLALIALVVGHMGDGTVERAEQVVSEAEALSELLDGYGLRRVRQLQARVCLLLGRLDEAAALIDESLRLGPEHELLETANALVWRGEIERRRGDQGQSVATLRRALGLTVDSGFGEPVLPLLHQAARALQAHDRQADTDRAIEMAWSLGEMTGQCPPVGLEVCERRISEADLAQGLTILGAARSALQLIDGI